VGCEGTVVAVLALGCCCSAVPSSKGDVHFSEVMCFCLSKTMLLFASV